MCVGFTYSLYGHVHRHRHTNTPNNLTEDFIYFFCFGLFVSWFVRSKTSRMVIANGTYVSFCNQPKAHYLATSRRYVVAFSRIAAGGIWLRQESLRHILASLGTPLGQTRQMKEDSIMLVKCLDAYQYLQ